MILLASFHLFYFAVARYAFDKKKDVNLLDKNYNIAEIQ